MMDDLQPPIVEEGVQDVVANLKKLLGVEAKAPSPEQVKKEVDDIVGSAQDDSLQRLKARFDDLMRQSREMREKLSKLRLPDEARREEDERANKEKEELKKQTEDAGQKVREAEQEKQAAIKRAQELQSTLNNLQGDLEREQRKANELQRLTVQGDQERQAGLEAMQNNLYKAEFMRDDALERLKEAEARGSQLQDLANSLDFQNKGLNAENIALKSHLQALMLDYKKLHEATESQAGRISELESMLRDQIQRNVGLQSRLAELTRAASETVQREATGRIQAEAAANMQALQSQQLIERAQDLANLTAQQQQQLDVTQRALEQERNRPPLLPESEIPTIPPQPIPGSTAVVQAAPANTSPFVFTATPPPRVAGPEPRQTITGAEPQLALPTNEVPAIQGREHNPEINTAYYGNPQVRKDTLAALATPTPQVDLDQQKQLGKEVRDAISGKVYEFQTGMAVPDDYRRLGNRSRRELERTARTHNVPRPINEYEPNLNVPSNVDFAQTRTQFDTTQQMTVTRSGKRMWDFFADSNSNEDRPKSKSRPDDNNNNNNAS